MKARVKLTNSSYTQINIVVFILVIRQMMGTRHVQSKTEVEKVKAGVKASAVILPLLGITWLFGLLSFSSSTIAFKYIFAIGNSLQGLMIFIFHCLLNKQVRGLKYFECKANHFHAHSWVTWYKFEGRLSGGIPQLKLYQQLEATTKNNMK